MKKANSLIILFLVLLLISPLVYALRITAPSPIVLPTLSNNTSEVTPQINDPVVISPKLKIPEIEKVNTTNSTPVLNRTVIKNISKIITPNITVTKNATNISVIPQRNITLEPFKPKIINVQDLPSDLQKIVLTPLNTNRQKIVSITTVFNNTTSYFSTYIFNSKEKKKLLGVIPINVNTKYTIDQKGIVLAKEVPWYAGISARGNANDTHEISETILFQEADFPSLLTVDVGADLKICGIEGSCSGDVQSSHKKEKIEIHADKSLKRSIYFYTDDIKITEGLLQVSLQSFSQNSNPDIVYTKKISTGETKIDFSRILNQKSYLELAENIKKLDSLQVNKILNESGKTKLYSTNIFEEQDSNIFETTIDLDKIMIYPKYYLRVIPLSDQLILGLPSNEGSVEITAPVNSSDPSFQSPSLIPPKKIYSVEILDFTPLLAPDYGICSHAMILDTDWIWMGATIAKAGDRLCPKVYKGVGEQAWYESLWNAISSGLSWISEQYNALKKGIIDVVGAVACAGDETCKDALAMGLDIGLAAMGIPPSIPNIDEMMDQGLGYIASEIAEQAGCPDAACKEIIKATLKEAIEQTKNKNPACGDEAAAHDMGIEPLCLPAGVTAHWDPLATHRTAKVTVRITRNYLDADTAQDSVFVYRLGVGLIGYNENSVGGKIYNIEPYGKTLEITEPLQGAVFKPTYLNIPHLEKGETIEIPINLIATDYWVPGHKELMEGWTTVVYKDGWPQYQYNDWWKLYYGAKLNITTEINGCSYGYGSCFTVSSDKLETVLPMTLHP